MMMAATVRGRRSVRITASDRVSQVGERGNIWPITIRKESGSGMR